MPLKNNYICLQANKVADEMATDQYGFQAYPILLHPFSTGSLKLASKDPFQHPLIDPEYLKDDRDMQVFYNGR